MMRSSDPNFVNVMSPGLVAVALLAEEGFDAADVEVATLAFGPAGAAPALDRMTAPSPI
jgi:hypothetical protein